MSTGWFLAFFTNSRGNMQQARATTPTARSEGFTLVEVLIVVAIVGILAGLATYMFSSEKKKVSARSEVAAIFAELQQRQAQYYLENNTYLSTSATNAEADLWPTEPSRNGGTQSLLPLPANWTSLRFNSDKANVVCAFVAVTGAANDSTTIGTIASSTFNFTAPAEDWFYLLAQCDMDQDSTVDSYYFQPSGDQELYYANQGK